MAPTKRVATEESEGHGPHKKSRTASTPDLANCRHTRGMTTNAARKAVFNTSELLERIIVHLPAKNIFGIQRVCRQFKAVITTSPDIQKKQFLRLQNPDLEMWKLDYHEKNGQYRHPTEIRFRKAKAKTRGKLYRPVALNPLLELLLGEFGEARHRIYFNPNRNERVQMSFSQAHFGSEPAS